MSNASLSRREILSAAAMTSAALVLNPAASMATTVAEQDKLITKPIPASGEQLPVIGLGTNQFSVETAEELAGLQQVLERMGSLGGKVIDTARAYGRSEEVIGELLERMGERDRFFISTKTPARGELRSAAQEIQASLDRLRVSKIDLLLIHQLHGVNELMPGFIKAKEEGRIRYIGMSTSSDDQYSGQMEGMRRYPLDFIQVDYSIDNRNAAESILALAQERRIAVLINTPFGGRNRAAAMFERVSSVALPDWAAEFDATSWAQVFLKYVVSHPAVTTAIPGTTRVSHLVDNQGAGRGRLPDAAMRRRIEQYWDAL